MEGNDANNNANLNKNAVKLNQKPLKNEKK